MRAVLHNPPLLDQRALELWGALTEAQDEAQDEGGLHGPVATDAPSQSHSIRRAFGFAVAWFFSTSGPSLAVLCRAERPLNRPRTNFISS